MLLLGFSFTVAAQDNGGQSAEASRLRDQALELLRAKQYDEGIPLAKRALAIFERVLDPDELDIGMAANILAMLYDDKGDQVQAEPLYKRALEIYNKVFPPDEPLVAPALNRLAMLYYTKGDYVQAEPLFERVLVIREKELGPEHPDVADALSNLASLYHVKRDYGQAERLQLRALKINEKAFGPESLEAAHSLNNLAGIYYDSRMKYEQVELLLERALKIREKAFGPESLEVAQFAANLAMVYSNKGDSARAEQLYKRSLDIHEKILGPNDPKIATFLNNLATQYYVTGNYEWAESLYQRAMSIIEKAYGPEHPNIARVLGNLALLYHAKGDHRQGARFLTRLSEIREHNLAQILTSGSERQKQLYLNDLAGESNSIVSWHLQYAPRDEQMARLALTTILQRKGRALDAMADQIGVLRLHSTPEIESLLDKIIATRRRLAALRISGEGKLSPEEQRAEVARLTSEEERLEGEASRRSAEFQTQTLPNLLDAVRQALPADAALAEIFVYGATNLNALKDSEKQSTPHYVVYVLRHGETVPQWVELGDTAQIDEAAVRWLKELGNPPLRRKGEQISNSELQKRIEAHEAEVKKLARALDERLMRPIRKLIGPTRRIFLSPDGALNLIPFAALVDENGMYLVENYSINYLTSGRDLVQVQSQTENLGAPVVMADPLYDMIALKTPKQQAEQSSTLNGEGRRSVDFMRLNYKSLPGTAAEATALRVILPDARVLTKEQATEAALKQIKRPRVLHIATHGFFLSAQTSGSSTAGITLRRETVDTLGSAPPTDWENPLLRSGLILAGVKQERSGPGEDGVLTALEMAGLDLRGTKLVVLSACETGLGDVRFGAGVYGLRRALVLAGSETQVMSLWKVSDVGTRDLMTAYYKRSQTGEGRTEALRRVQLDMLHGRLSSSASSRKRGTSDTGEEVITKNYRHPYYWAAFIPSGDWRSMSVK